MQPSDEDPQGNILSEEEQAFIKMNDYHQTLNKEDTKPAAQPENEDISPSPEPYQRRHSKKEHEADHMKKLFATLAKKHPKTDQRTGRKARNVNCGHETSQLGHTKYVNNKNNTCPNNE
jgi:hypothetical protein